ncbi:hypothetical protein MishRS11D_02910 [Methylomagnum ishizawai]|nr:hypothetical protein MishRS11D_02910 [Methylomagnum ishizawai]
MIDRVGFVGVVAVRDGVIAKGHGTLAACRRLLAEGKDIHPAPGRERGAPPFPRGQLPVQDCTGWTDAEFRAFVAADNQLGLLSGWDDDLLRLNLDGLELDGFDLGDIGFSGDELERLLALPDRATPPEPGFQPALDPGTDHRQVTDAEVDRAQARADGRFSGGDARRKAELLCPNCAESFHMNADDLALILRDAQ